MFDIFLIGCSILVIFAVFIWILSMITVPLAKASISLIFLIVIFAIITIIVLAFWSMGVNAFIILGILLVAFILKFFGG